MSITNELKTKYTKEFLKTTKQLSQSDFYETSAGDFFTSKNYLYLERGCIENFKNVFKVKAQPSLTLTIESDNTKAREFDVFPLGKVKKPSVDVEFYVTSYFGGVKSEARNANGYQ